MEDQRVLVNRTPGSPCRADRPLAKGSVATMVCLLFGIGCGDSGQRVAGEMLDGLARSKIAGTRGSMEAIASGLGAYAIDHSGYPATERIEEVMSAMIPAHLRTSIDVDAWGQSLVYRSDGNSYTLSSVGPDGRLGTADDLVMIDGRFTNPPRPDV